jgi:hypothetical protein
MTEELESISDPYNRDMTDLCSPVVRVSEYRTRDPGFVSLSYQIFWTVEGLERGPLSLMRTTEELLE